MAFDPGTPEDGLSTRERFRRAFLTGTALMIPLVLTLVVFQLALNLVSQAVSPIVSGFQLVFGADEAPQLLLEVVTVVTLLAIILVIGFVAEFRSDSGHISETFDALMARIPGLGSVYTGTRRMSEVLLEQDTQSFQEVKLVEFPREGAFMIGFLTAQPPDSIQESADESSMQTLFVPLAPNPVMGGFLTHLPDERVHDVDLTVEEGVQSIVTSGAAIDTRVDDVDAHAGIADAEFLEGDLIDWDGLESDLLPGENDEDEAGKPG